jgi:dihydropteroate synthase
MAEAGAAILDIGGESTRPGAAAVSVQEELDRVMPVVEALAGRAGAVVSIDTSKPQVMRAAAAAGAGMVNDVFALRAEGAVEAVGELGMAACLMHMQGTPRTMQANPVYGDVIAEVRGFLAARVRACIGAGIPEASLVVDPGFGFGKTLEHNLTLLRGLGRLRGLGPPVLAGLSRKSFVGKITGREDMDERVHGSIAFALAALKEGASLLRVHDVPATVDAVKVWQAVYRD